MRLRDRVQAVSWVLVVLSALVAGCRRSGGDGVEAGAIPNAATRAALEQLRPQVETFCGACHAPPDPQSFARDDWDLEVARGYQFYGESGREDLVVPPIQEVINYYKAYAPETLVLRPPTTGPDRTPVRFRPQVVPTLSGIRESGVSSIVWNPPTAQRRGELLVCDMYHGIVARVVPGAPLEFEALARLKNPAHMAAADLDGDGRQDYVVAELGSFPPQDHDKGAVVWLRADEQGNWSSSLLAKGLGRVAQVQIADFDGDRDADILVAEFGWIRTGKLRLLRREGVQDGLPKFTAVELDPRHGISSIPPVDWNQDGRLDFVALVTQEYESVELFLNQPDGTFQKQQIYAGPHPAFGSSGLEIVDLDRDGDLDILYTNGDSMDSMQLKPYHAVWWLENRGEFPFVEHQLTLMPGVYKAVAADFDGDGDLDVMAQAMQHSKLETNEVDTLVLLEQTEPGVFRRHRQPSKLGSAALVAADFDQDGDIDFASGAFSRNSNRTWVTLWWNEGLR